MFTMAAVYTQLALLLCTCALAFSKEGETESCRTYAGGQVYPQETKIGLDHALHWSKALSK